MKWIIEQGVFNENYLDPMEEALRDLGLARDHGYEIIKYVPFADATYLPIVPDNQVIVYGSLNLLKQTQRLTAWDPGAGVTWNNYKCSTYFPYYHKFLLNNSGIWVPWGEAQLRREEIFSLLGNPCFIKSAEGAKQFIGGPYTYEEFVREREWPHPESMMLFMDRYRPIETECVDNKFISGTQYRANGKKEVISEYPFAAFEAALDAIEHKDSVECKERYDSYTPAPATQWT